MHSTFALYNHDRTSEVVYAREKEAIDDDVGSKQGCWPDVIVDILPLGRGRGGVFVVGVRLIILHTHSSVSRKNNWIDGRSHVKITY